MPLHVGADQWCTWLLCIEQARADPESRLPTLLWTASTLSWPAASKHTRYVPDSISRVSFVGAKAKKGHAATAWQR